MTVGHYIRLKESLKYIRDVNFLTANDLNLAKNFRFYYH